MDDIDTISSTRSIRKAAISDIDEINADEPKPKASLSHDLVEKIRAINSSAGSRLRMPLSSKRTITSIRIIPDTGSTPTSSARSYQPPESRYPETRKPNKNLTSAEQAYIWRMKFQRLNDRNPKIPIPETNDPAALEHLYIEAIRTDHYSSTSSTWLIYMGIGYAVFQWGLHKLGFELPSNFVLIQMEVMSHYPQLLKALGDPGGPSLGSSWPPWLKLLFVICVHTLIFILIFKMTGSVDSAHNAQRFICQTGLMGGKPQGDEVEADNAMSNIGGLLGGLGGIFGGNNGTSGFGNMFTNLVGKVMGSMGMKDTVAEVDLDNEKPISERTSISFVEGENQFDD